jgi:hypothetical protein
VKTSCSSRGVKPGSCPPAASPGGVPGSRSGTATARSSRRSTGSDTPSESGGPSTWRRRASSIGPWPDRPSDTFTGYAAEIEGSLCEDRQHESLTRRFGLPASPSALSSVLTFWSSGQGRAVRRPQRISRVMAAMSSSSTRRRSRATRCAGTGSPPGSCGSSSTSASSTRRPAARTAGRRRRGCASTAGTR